MKKIDLITPGNPLLKLLPVISLFIFAAFFVPRAGSIFLFFLPLILFFNGTVNGMARTAAAFLISYLLFLIFALMLHLNVPFVAVLATGVAGLLMTGCAVRNYSIEKTIIYPSLFLVGTVCGYFIYEGFLMGTDPWQLVQKFITEIIKEQENIYSKLPLKAEDIQFFKDNEKNMIDGFAQIFPAIIVVASVLTVWINFLLGKKILEKGGIFYPGFVMLARWKAPDAIIWIFIVSGALFFVPQPDVNFAGLNIFMVVCFAYLMQGLAIVSFLFQVKNTPPFFRYFFYFLIAVQQILMIPILVIGLFDIWVDFRKLFQKNQTAA